MTPVASGSSRTRVGTHAIGCCRWRLPDWPRWAIAGRSGRMANSSDGAGVALPLDRSILRPHRRGRSGRRASGGRFAVPAARADRPNDRPARSSRRPSRESALPVVAWRTVPVDVAALGASAAASRPAFAQAVVARPSRTEDDPRPISDAAFERRLVVARRRLETAARAAGGAVAGLSVPSASARTIVYKGLVIGSRLPDLYPDLREPLAGRLHGLPPALRHEHASRSGGSPSRSARSPITARSTRSAATASRSAAGPPTPPAPRSRGRSWRPVLSCPRTAPIRCRSTRRSSS